jgi:glycosyltransferase involved in cell wall biosynthesis
MAMQLPFVSIVIPVHNDRARLPTCLQALYYQTYPYHRYEVIVVDNNSTEDIPSIAQQFPNVQYTMEAKPGNNAARNRGLSIAKGEFIAFTDADCIPDREWLAEGVRSLLANPDAGIIGGAIQFFCQGDRPTPVEYADSVCYLQQAVYVQRDRYAAGANLFTRRSVIQHVGGFEERLLNLGDKEWGQRVAAAGFGVRYEERAIVHHPARATLSALLAKARRQTQAQITLGELRGECLPRISFLPMGWQFFCHVARDENLPTLKEKLQFVWIMHRVKWAIAWELFGNRLRRMR